MGGNLPFIAAYEENEPDDIRCGDFGPWLANKSGDSRGAEPEARRRGTMKHSRTHVTGKRLPTEKQILFARAISMTLDIDLPEELTRQSLFLFIRDNRPKYDVVVHNNRVRSIAEHSEDPDPIDPDEDALMMEAYGLDPYTGGFADNY